MNEPTGFMGGNDLKRRQLPPDLQEAWKAGVPGAAIPPLPRPFQGFEVERATYERLKPELLARAEGKFVVVVGNDWAGPVEKADDAEAIGYARFGIGPLYIKRVLAEDPIEEISREFAS